jgi:pimeloyl-ACP methyl ester carboxylesterase
MVSHGRGLLLGVLLLAACAGLPRTRTPMPVLRYHAATTGAHHPDTLYILLPGRKDRADVFAREGIIDLLRQHGLAADIVAADAHAGYYVRGSLVRQLHDEVIVPARRRGYRNLVLVGFSLGGYGAIRYAMAHPGEISTLVLLSPFLGTGPFMRELAEAGDEDFAQTWSWLKAYPLAKGPDERTAAGYPRLILGYGAEDMFLHTDNQLRALLPPEDTVTTAGAHVWSTWRDLLTRMFDKGLLGST